LGAVTSENNEIVVRGNGHLARPAAPLSSAARNQISARQPLLYAAVAFSGGLCAGKFMWRPPSWWVVASLVFVCCAIYLLRRRALAASALALGTIFTAGALTIQVRGHYSQEVLSLGNGEEVVVTAHVIAEGELQQDTPGSWRQRIDVETEKLEGSSRAWETRAGVRLNIYSQEKPDFPVTKSMPLFRYGQRIKFPAMLIAPRNFRNPGAFDYAGYLRDKGISATASTKFNSLEVLPGFSGTRIEQWRAGIHRSIITKVHALWPAEAAGLMDAIVIGEETFIERPTRVDFQRSGTYHVLVVSGMNVSILALFTLWALRRIALGQVVASGCAIALIFGYAAVTNVGPPVWRAALMFTMYLATRLLYRDRAMLNALGTAALALLIVDPQSLFGASFQMTFLCVGLVAGIGVPLLERTIEPFSRGLRNLDSVAYDRHLPPAVAQFRLDLRLLLGRLQEILPGWIARTIFVTGFRFAFGFGELVVMSGIMQFGLALPMAYYFHRATSVAMPANLLIIPFLQLLMPTAVIAIAVSYVSLTLAKLPAAVSGIALQGIAGTVKWLGGLQLADIRVPTPGVAAILFAAVAIAVCVALMRKQRPLAIAGATILTASAMWIWTFPPRPQVRAGILEMTAIDVGQGDSLFLALPDGKTLLVDAGGLPFWTHSQMDIGEDVVSPYLWSRGISRIDAISLTHAHADHMGGMAAVIANFRPRELWLPEGIPSEEIRALLGQAHRMGLKITYRQAGDTFSFGTASFRVLAPVPKLPSTRTHEGKEDQRRNDESLVMKVSFGKTSALLEADAERPTGKFLADEDPAADVVKVAHHGSASSTNEYLLEAVHPRFAVISVGARNVYHHPRAEVLGRLQQARVTTYRTDLDGATSFFLDGENITARLAVLP
jgi:competence protein ComEC